MLDSSPPLPQSAMGDDDSAIHHLFFPASASSKYTSSADQQEEPMPLHNTEELKAPPTSPLEAEIHDENAQTYEFPESRQDAQTVYQTIHNQLILDGNSQQNLATFCTTWIEPEVQKIMDESADKN